jgi:hypothetical protein
MADFIEKRNALDDCMYGIIWWLPKSVITPETYEKIRNEIDSMYDKAYRNGADGK